MMSDFEVEEILAEEDSSFNPSKKICSQIYHYLNFDHFSIKKIFQLQWII